MASSSVSKHAFPFVPYVPTLDRSTRCARLNITLIGIGHHCGDHFTSRQELDDRSTSLSELLRAVKAGCLGSDKLDRYAAGPAHLVQL
jgi:hypothetical protein